MIFKCWAKISLFALSFFLTSYLVTFAFKLLNLTLSFYPLFYRLTVGYFAISLFDSLIVLYCIFQFCFNFVVYFITLLTALTSLDSKGEIKKQQQPTTQPTNI